MQFGIRGEILRLESAGLLEGLLFDRTTRRGILWATDAYEHLGDGYRPAEEMTAAAITGVHSDLIRTRALKAMEQQTARTRKHAEVFTPLWICEKMISHADALWWGGRDPFAQAPDADGHIVLPKKKSWTRYIDSRRLEITCGEAPYLAQPYDVSTGEILPLAARGGLLDRKLRLASERAETEAEWCKQAFRAVESIYGYEFQGDNLLIARLNLLLTFENYLEARWHRTPTEEEYRDLLKIITWNLWQMDGLTGTVPYAEDIHRMEQTTLFPPTAEEGDVFKETRPAGTKCRIKDWRRSKSKTYLDIAEIRRRNMGTKKERNIRFDFIIGNPPYQEETVNTSDKPIYNLFMDEAYRLSDHVELITPARFLFNAGKTPNEWNQKMLNDPHLTVLWYEPKSDKVFPGTDIKGGVVITYHNTKKDYGKIGIFTAFPELNSIEKKVTQFGDFESVEKFIYPQNKFNLEALYQDHPEYKNIVGSGGKEKRLTTPIFTQLEVFSDEKKSEDEIKILGLIQNKRHYRYISDKYLGEHGNLKKYKVLLPKSNGSGALGEVLSTPLIGEPLIGYTQSFIGIGAFDTQAEAEACLKYIKSKFARVMLGILKITQDNNSEKWRYVPLQDFTDQSDIDWTQPVSDIDRQLYKKYGLSEEEISFIEDHVKEMK